MPQRRMLSAVSSSLGTSFHVEISTASGSLETFQTHTELQLCSESSVSGYDHCICLHGQGEAKETGQTSAAHSWLYQVCSLERRLSTYICLHCITVCLFTGLTDLAVDVLCISNIVRTDFPYETELDAAVLCSRCGQHSEHQAFGKTTSKLISSQTACWQRTCFPCLFFAPCHEHGDWKYCWETHSLN